MKQYKPIRKIIPGNSPRIYTAYFFNPINNKFSNELHDHIFEKLDSYIDSNFNVNIRMTIIHSLKDHFNTTP